MKTSKASEKIWVSVDGGGTKTQVCAGDASGRLLFNETFGGINYKASDIESVKQVLDAAVRKLLDTTGAENGGIAGMVMGISGCDTAEDLDLYYGLMERLGLVKPRLYICNDTEFAFRALSDKIGISMVGGTGSIAYAYRDGNVIDRAGGWGSPLSDEGSGYWIGARVLSRLIRWLDGTQSAAFPVYERILETLGTSVSEAASKIATLGIPQVAAYSALVFEQARLGDDLCRETMREAISELLKLYVTLARRNAFEAGIDLVVVGGLFNDSGFRESFFQQAQDALPGLKAVCIHAGPAPALDGLSYVRKRYSQQES